MVITQPRPITPETAIGGGWPVLVIAPRSAHGRQTAQNLHRALQKIGAAVEIQEDPADSVMREARGPVILVGNLADSRSIRWLYYRSLCATDLWYPGPKGHELRTLCNPFGSGHNLILVGYSDAEGARIAGERFQANLADPIPHLKDLHATRLPLSAIEANDSRTVPQSTVAAEVVNSWQGDITGFLYYLTGEPAMGAAYKDAWKAYLACGYEKSASIVQSHLYSLIRFLPWRVVEDMDLFTTGERLAITQFIYGWAESGEGWRHVAACKRTQRNNNQRQNHELVPSLTLFHAANYFETFFPVVTGPAKWREVARTAFAPYGRSWKSLCDGLCHGWWLSQPVLLEQAILDPTHRYFTDGGARQAAEGALAVVNNDGWLPSAGDTDIKRQFPGIVLRMASDYFGDGRYKFAHDLATPDRQFTWPILFPRAFAGGVEARVPDDLVGITVVSVDPLLYHVWEHEPELALEAVPGPPSAPIDQCFDKLSVRSGWNLADDFLLIDGLGGGSHSYDDAAGIVEYARLGVSLIVQEDSFVHSAPEHHSVVTIVRNGETGVIPGFAILEEKSIDQAGTVYLKLRSKDHAGADWVREIHLLPGKGMAIVDTVTANTAGDFAIEAHFRTPTRLVLAGSVARGQRPSPCCDEVEVRFQSLSAPHQLSLTEVPVHLRYPTQREVDAWCERYRTNEMVLIKFTARETAHLEPGESVRLVHLAQGRAPAEPTFNLSQNETGLFLTDGQSQISLPTFAIRPPQVAGTATRSSSTKPGAEKFFETDSAITAFWHLDDGSLVVGTKNGTLTQVLSDGRQKWTAKLEGPVHAIGSTPGLIVAGHGAAGLTAFNPNGQEQWTTKIVRDPCPWPWWELSTPAAIQVAGGMVNGEPFFAVGCGDIQLRCFDGKGVERWRWRYNEGVPGRVVITDVDGSGEPRIVVGGDILTDVSTCRILTPEGKQVAQMAVEGWTSMLTALAFGHTTNRRFIGCGANRGNNLHLFELEDGLWQRCWLKQPGGQVNGIAIFGDDDRVIVGTSQGFLLGYDFKGNPLWHQPFARGLSHLVKLDNGVLTVDASGGLSHVTLSGRVESRPPLPGPCSNVATTDQGIHFACGLEIWRLL